MTCCLPARCFRHRLENLHVASAAAEVAREPFADIFHRGRRLLVQKVQRRENHSRGADATLRTPAIQKCLLEIVQMLTGDSLYGKNISVSSLQKRQQATVHENTVDQYCTGTAFALSAAFLWPGESQALTQYVEQSFH